MSLLRHLIVVITLLFLGGCSATLIPSNEGGSFVITEDILFVHTGIGGAVPKLLGLTPGEYIAVGHNDEGIYYRGPRGCLVILDEAAGEHYRKTGERPMDVSHLLISNGYSGEGGVLIPYDPKDSAYFYVYQDFRRHTGDTESKMPTRPSSDVNTWKGDTPMGDVIPFRPATVLVTDPLNPGLQPTPAAALGASIAPYVGRAIATPGLRDMQGTPQLLYKIDYAPLLNILHTVMREKRYLKSTASPGESTVARQ